MGVQLRPIFPRPDANPVSWGEGGHLIGPGQATLSPEHQRDGCQEQEDESSWDSELHCGNLQRQRYRHLVAGVLPGAARAIGPHLERELLLLSYAEAEPHEKQGFASQAEHFVQSQRARVYEERFDQRLPHPAALLVVAHGKAGDFRELGAETLRLPVPTMLPSGANAPTYSLMCPHRS